MFFEMLGTNLFFEYDNTGIQRHMADIEGSQFSLHGFRKAGTIRIGQNSCFCTVRCYLIEIFS